MGAENGRILLPRERGAFETKMTLKVPTQWGGVQSLVCSHREVRTFAQCYLLCYLFPYRTVHTELFFFF